jgi:spore coat protein SA
LAVTIERKGEQMRVALICPPYLPCPPIQGGAIELLVSRVSPILAELGYNVTVYSIRNSSLPDVEVVKKVTYIRVPKNNYLREVLHHLSQNSYDLIQVYNEPRWVSTIKKALPKSTVVLSLHNLLLGQRTGDQASRQAVEKADHIVTVSKFVAHDIKRQYPEASRKMTALYTGDDPKLYNTRYSPKGRMISEQWKSKLGIPKNFTVLLFVGRLQPKKGIHHVVDAMRFIKEKHPQTALVIVGSSSYKNKNDTDYVRTLKEKAANISEHIYFTSLIPADKLPVYYTMSDMLVCASQWEEPLARVQYEAMAAGIPVVTTKRGGNTEIIQHGKTGYVVERYEDPKAFADAIMQLLKNPKARERIGKTNRALIVNKYNFKQYARNISAVYRKIAKS